MAVLIALVVLAYGVVSLNLLLTVGVIRRLREHTERLASLTTRDDSVLIKSAGERVAEFSAATTDGGLVSRSSLAGHTLIGVLSAQCEVCEEQLPMFLSFARSFPGGRHQVVVVLCGEPAEVEVYRGQLAPVAKVVIEPAAHGTVASALAVRGWPAFAVLDEDGTVIASGPRVIGLSAAAIAG